MEVRPLPPTAGNHSQEHRGGSNRAPTAVRSRPVPIELQWRTYRCFYNTYTTGELFPMISRNTGGFSKLKLPLIVLENSSWEIKFVELGVIDDVTGQINNKMFEWPQQNFTTATWLASPIEIRNFNANSADKSAFFVLVTLLTTLPNLRWPYFRSESSKVTRSRRIKLLNSVFNVLQCTDTDNIFVAI